MKVLDVFYQMVCMGSTASIVILAILLIRACIRRFPRKYAYVMWMIAGIRLVCPVTAVSPLSVFNLPPASETSSFSDRLMEYQEDRGEEKMVLKKRVLRQDKLTGIQVAATDSDPSRGAVADAAEQSRGNMPVSRLWKLMAGVWLAGVFLLLLWNFCLMASMKKRLRKAVLYRENIYECEDTSSPFVFGLLRPRIYIPFRLGQEESEYVLQHEQCHIRRRDHFVKFFAFLILAIYWFHPLVWVAYRCMVRDMEMSCDEYVLASMGKDIRKEYSRSLLAFAANHRQFSAGMIAFGEIDIEKRIRHILKFHKKSKWVGILAGIFIIITAFVCLTNGTTKGIGADEKERGGEKVLAAAGADGDDNSAASDEKGKAEDQGEGFYVDGRVRIEIYRPEDAVVGMTYSPAEEYQEKLSGLAEKLDVERGCTKAMKKKWMKEQEAGYGISYQGNTWTVYTGGYMSFWSEDNLRHTVMYMPELYQEAERICREDLGYKRIAPSEIRQVVSAELSYKEQSGGIKKQKITEKSKLETLEEILREAEYVRDGSGCPFGTAVLTMKLESGKEIKLTWADDGCRIIRINGVYYEYQDQMLEYSPNGIRALFDQIPWKGV